MSALLQAEVAHLRAALKAARTYRTALAYPTPDEALRHLRASVEVSIQALEQKLAAARYRLVHAEVRQ